MGMQGIQKSKLEDSYIVIYLLQSYRNQGNEVLT